MQSLRRQAAGPLLAGGAGAQLAVLVVVAAGPGLAPCGWAAGIGYGAVLLALLATAVGRTQAGTLGPADVVTLARAVLVGGVLALVVDLLWTGRAAHPGALQIGWLVGLAGTGLLLDAVDGQVARRTGTVSALGARFDMEVDAFLILVLSAHMASLLGPWVLAIGLMRYAFVAAGWVLSWLRGELPVSYAAKAIAVVQGIVLVVAAAGVLPTVVAAVLVALALLLLSWSFGRSTVQLATRVGVGVSRVGPLQRPARSAVVGRVPVVPCGGS